MDYQALVQRLRARISDRRRGFQPSRFERQIYTDAATAITDLLAKQRVLVEEVEAWRHWEVTDKLVGTEDEVDVNANNAWTFVEQARAATDAAFPGGLTTTPHAEIPKGTT